MDILRDTYKLALEHWVLTSLVVFVTYTYWHYITKFTVLQKQGFKGPTPWPIIGNSFDILRGKPLHDIFLRMTRKYGEVYGFYFLGIPCIMVSDPDILKAVLVKDFDKFHDRPVSSTNEFRVLRDVLPEWVYFLPFWFKYRYIFLDFWISVLH